MLVSLASTKAALLVAAHLYGNHEHEETFLDMFEDASWRTEECGHMELAHYLRGAGYPAITDTVGGRNLHKAWAMQAQRGYLVLGLFATSEDRAGYGWAMAAHLADGSEVWCMVSAIGTHIIGKVATDEVYTGVCTVVTLLLPPQGTVHLYK